MEFHRLCVIGLGYIGLPTASSFAAYGLKVLGVDNNPLVISTIRNGGIHINEPGLRMVVHEAIASGNLVVSEIPEPADAFIIAVPTPFFEDELGEYEGQSYRKADMRAVISAIESIVPHLRQGNLVVLESTSPPRTTVDLVQPILERSGMKAGVDFYLAYSPERVLPGQILRELLENARVIGGVNQPSAEAGRDLYACFVKSRIILSDATTAEMVKLMENTSRDINIAIANEFSRLAQRFGIDVWEAIKIANLHPRVNILNPGPGVGGHCISVDPWFLVEAAPDLTKLILTAREVNDSQPNFVLKLIQSVAGENLTGKHIAILGIAFKPDVDDLRESPAIEVIKRLTQAGAIVSAYEPNKKDAEISDIKITQSLQDAVVDADLVVLLVAHREFKELEPQKLRELTPARLLIDTVGCWAIQPWSEAGFILGRLGVGRNE